MYPPDADACEAVGTHLPVVREVLVEMGVSGNV